MRKLSTLLSLLLVAVICNAEEARLLRFPSVGGDKIAFTYAGDLYSVSINGGAAQKLTSHVGFEMFSRFSPDGKTIAFTAQYDGNTEVYTIPAQGGVPKRITWTANVSRDNIGDRMGPNSIVMCWTPDGKDIVFRTKWYNFSGLRGQLYKVPVNGGDMEQIPTTEGGFCSYSPDGKKLAMNRMFREFRTWKYYRGGQADDIWINTVGTTKLENITNNEAQDIFPMWIGSEIYFLSDRDHTMNLFCYNTKSKETRKVTDFTEYDCKFPSYSKDYVVFENGGFIYKYSVKEQKCEKVSIEINDEQQYSRPIFSDSPSIGNKARSGRGYDLSPDGERVIANIRGEIFSIPAETGAIYNLTRTPGVHEREAAWSPDGKYIAYFSDATGEYQLYIMDSEDNTKVSALSDFKNGYPRGITWSKDSKKIFFTTDKKEFYAADVASKSLKKILEGKYSNLAGYDISKDGSWITYATASKNEVYDVWLYDTAADKHYKVTTSWYNSYNPLFSEDGKYLFFASSRDYRSRYSRVEWNASYEVSDYVFVLPLAKSTPNPTLIKGDEYTPKASENPSDKPAGKDSKEAKSPKSDKMVIDIDGIAERAVSLPLPSGMYSLVGSIGDELYFSERGSEIKKISMKDMKVSSVTKSRIIAATADNKKALISDKGGLYVVSAPMYKAGDKEVPIKDAKVLIDYSKEWNQIFNETWRIFRDGFYLENMHGKDWNAIHDKYAALLPYVNHRQDLTYIIGEMIGELNVGHSYVTTGEAPLVEKVPTGLLGAQFSKDKSGYFKIEKIFKGETWGNNLRSPLYEQEVSVGEFILAVDGVSCKEMGTIYESLIGKAGVVVALKVSKSANGKDSRTIYVKPISDESQLAYYEWVQNNIKKVEKASNGEIGYIHIPDMSTAGLDEFTKLFYSQLDKKALIIDDRMNGGGNVSPMIIERLNRVVYRMNMYRNGSIVPGTIPDKTHHGPKVCLVDKYSSSDGDLFPYGFQRLGIGKIIGTRTWGGIVGISGSKPYLDGQDVRTPFFTSYSTDGKWIVENHGIDPDIVVDINPFEDFKGYDAQLEKAIEVLKAELKNYKPLQGVPAPRVMP